MNITTMRIFAAILGTAAGAVISHLIAMSIRAYPRAFNEEAIRGKCAIGFLIGVGWIIRTIFWSTFCWPCAIATLIGAPIVGGIALTIAHFVGEIIWEALTDIWSVCRSFYTSTKEHTVAPV